MVATPPLGGKPALGIQLHHGAVAERLDLLSPAQPYPLLSLRATSGRELTRVEGREHRIERRGSRLASAAARGGDGALADRFGVACGHAEAVPLEGLAQRRPGGAQLLRGGIHAAESFRQREGAFGLRAVGQEAAGLPAPPPAPSQRGRRAWRPPGRPCRSGAFERPPAPGRWRPHHGGQPPCPWHARSIGP
jgi:hypothetical protein